MKRLIPVLVMLGIGGLATSAMAYNYHNATTLICSDCHTAHASQSHDNDATGPFKNVPIGTLKPYDNLLRNEPNELCLTCHDNNGSAPDVLGDNNGKYPAILRQAGALNEAGLGDAGYDNPGHGHTLGYVGAIPGSNPVITLGADGLECVTCHAQHGSKTQYRNLLSRNITAPGGAAITYSGKTVTYATLDTTTAAVAATKHAVIETADLSYAASDIKFGEPTTTASAYGNWCKSCHSDFHGSAGGNMGGASGGFVLTGTPWKRHPTADVNIGGAVTDSMTHVSSLAQYATYYAAGEGHYPKVMDSQGLWTGAYNKTTRTGDNTVTPSCFSCHKGHGNKNDFGLIFMGGGATPSEEGDGGSFRTMCRGCHSQASP